MNSPSMEENNHKMLMLLKNPTKDGQRSKSENHEDECYKYARNLMKEGETIPDVVLCVLLPIIRGKKQVLFFENQNQGARTIVVLPSKIEDREDGDQLLFFLRKSEEEFRGRLQKKSEEEEIGGRR